MEDSFSQVALLYELSLTNLKHKRPEENAKQFIKKFLSRKALNYGAVWLFGEREDDLITCTNLYSIPMLREKLVLPYQKIRDLFGDGEVGLTQESIFFGDELRGHFAYFKLYDLGMLELYSANHPEKLNKEAIYPFLNVVRQLAMSLESGFAFERLQNEIEQRKIAEQYHLNSEEKYRKIIDNIDLGLVEVDNDEKILYANESFLRLMGYDIDELIGKRASQVFVNTDDQGVTERLHAENQRRKQGLSSHYELPITDKTGSTKWAIVSGAPIKDGKGEVVGSVGIHLDITEKKEREISERKLLAKLAEQNSQLNEKQRYLKGINDFAAKLMGTDGIENIVKEIIHSISEQFEFPHCCVYLLDQDRTRLIRFSGEAGDQKIFRGKDLHVVPLGKEIMGLASWDGQPRVINNPFRENEYVCSNGKAGSIMTAPIVSDGEILGVLSSEHPQKEYYTREHLDTFKTLANLSATKIKNAIIQEKRRQVERALFESESKLRLIIESALDAVITIDLEGKITEWNPQAEILFGYTKEEALGNNMSTLIIPEKYRKGHQAGMERFRQTGETRVSNKRIEITGLHKEGQEFPIEISIKPVSIEGKTFFSAFARDITQRKKAEQDMKTALDKQKDLNKMKSQFVAMASHEFRTPLTTIQTNIELLSHRMENEELKARDKIDKSFGRISSELQRLTILMNEILLMGKIESGNIPFKPAPLSIKKLVYDVIDQSFSNQSDGRSVELNIQGDERDVHIDPNIYTHVITNLVSNAFKYSMGAPNPALNVVFEQEHFEIHVQDHGIGIPEEDIPKLFNSFYRAENVGNIQGTGLGLSIVKEFVQLHRGKIKIKSQKDKGTTFSIHQPYISFKD